jgi:hypothetical protein
MKNVLIGIGIGIVGTVLFGLGWISHGMADKASTTSSSSDSAPTATTVPGNPAPNTPPEAPHPALVSQSEFQQLQAARDAAMQANPDLAAEYKQIIKDLQNEQNELDTAMIKADPKVEPIVAKLVALRQRNGAPAPSSSPVPR